MLDHDLTVTKPDYEGGSIVNLMSSVKTAFGQACDVYPQHRELSADRLRRAERVVLLVIDGLGADLLESLAVAGRGTGALQSAASSRMTSVYPPTTASAVTTFLSGQAPQQHGLTGWFMHFRELGVDSAVLPFVSRFAHTSLSASGVAIGDVVDCDSLFDTIDVPSTLLQPEAIADSDFSSRLGGRAEREGFDGLDDFVQRLAKHCRGDTTSRYVHAYWSELDHLAHLHGPSSTLVADHFETLERALTPVFEACAQYGTLLVVTADHGFLDSGPAERIDLADHRELAAMLSGPLFGEPRSAYCFVRRACHESFEDYIAEHLADRLVLRRSEALIAEHWFGLGPAHPELAARVGDYTLQMRERYTIRDQLAGERPFDLHGMHGGVSAAEQWVPLVLFGA